MYEILDNTEQDLGPFLDLAHKFVPYAQKFLKYKKPVQIEFISDSENAKRLLGRTAFYDPEQFKIAVYTDGRHAKDILRSLSHELVHHAQNCRGEFDKPHTTGEGYIKKDPHMQNMEGEAYLLGNGFIIRFFEEYIKENGIMAEMKVKISHKKSPQVLEEGKSLESGLEEELDGLIETLEESLAPETVEAYKIRRKQIVADRLIDRWIKK